MSVQKTKCIFCGSIYTRHYFLIGEQRIDDGYECRDCGREWDEFALVEVKAEKDVNPPPEPPDMGSGRC